MNIGNFKLRMKIKFNNLDKCMRQKDKKLSRNSLMIEKQWKKNIMQWLKNQKANLIIIKMRKSKSCKKR